MTATMEADRSTEEMSEAVAAAGHNNPPEPTPFEKISEEIETLYGEARLWLDGAPVATQGQADGIAKLLNMIRDAAKRADLLRIAENKPFDDGKAEVQRRYAALIADTKGMKGKTTIATDACKKALAPWLDRLDREMKAEAERLQVAAEDKARAAQEAIRATAGDNIAEREAAETLLKDAKKAETTANRAAKDTAKASGGIGKAVSLRTSYVPVMVDPILAARHFWQVNQQEFHTFLMSLAEQAVRHGKREIPGFEVREIKTAV